MSKYKAIIGRFEHMDIVDAHQGVPAKIDTGAYRSSIHASNIKTIKIKGVEYLIFQLLGHPVFEKSTSHRVKRFKKIVVRSSNGHLSERYEVTLRVRLGYKVFSTSFTLSDRSENIFPILIGRRALIGRFLINPQSTGVDRKELKRALKLPLDEEDLEGVNT